MAVQLRRDGEPAQVFINQDLLKQIQREVEQGVDVAGPIVRQVLKRGTELSIDGSALSAKATVGMPCLNPLVDCSAAETKAALIPRVEASVDRSLPAAKQVINSSIQSSVKVTNSSFQSFTNCNLQ